MDKCFVIMPFSDPFNRYYEDVFKPAITEAGLEPFRADDLFTASNIINDIWAEIREAKIVLAEMTAHNPNVMYELGLAHALAKPTVLISERAQDIPFDLNSTRTITYDKDDPKWGEKLQENIKKSIIATIEAPSSSILPTFLHTSENSESENEVTLSEKHYLELKNTINALIKRLEYAEGVPDISRASALHDFSSLQNYYNSRSPNHKSKIKALYEASLELQNNAIEKKEDYSD